MHNVKPEENLDDPQSIHREKISIQRHLSTKKLSFPDTPQEKYHVTVAQNSDKDTPPSTPNISISQVSTVKIIRPTREINTSDIPNTPEGSLVILAKKLQLALGIEPIALKRMVDDFVNRVFYTTANSKTHFAKVNIYNELTKSKMTIKVFFKFLRIIKIKKFTFIIRATTHTDKIVEVEHNFNVFQGVSDDE